MLLSNFKRGKDRRKRKRRSLTDSSKPWREGQKPFIGNKFKKPTYMTPIGGAVKVGLPVAVSAGLGGATGYVWGAVLNKKNPLKGALTGGALGAGLLGSAAGATVLSEHRRTPQSILYKSRKKSEKYY